MAGAPPAHVQSHSRSLIGQALQEALWSLPGVCGFSHPNLVCPGFAGFFKVPVTLTSRDGGQQFIERTHSPFLLYVQLAGLTEKFEFGPDLILDDTEREIYEVLRFNSLQSLCCWRSSTCKIEGPGADPGLPLTRGQALVPDEPDRPDP